MPNRGRTTLGMLVIVLAAFAIPAYAATTISVAFMPRPLIPGETIFARLTDSQGSHCWPAATSITQVGTTITVSLSFSDSCSPSGNLPYRDYSLGSLPVGNYLFVYRSCSNNPPPLPSTCNTVLQVPFIVAAPISPAPALSWWGMLGLIIGMFGIAAKTVVVRSKHSLN